MGVENKLVYIDLGRNCARTYQFGVNRSRDNEIVLVDQIERRGYYQVVVIQELEPGNPGRLIHEGVYRGELLTTSEDLLALAETV